MTSILTNPFLYLSSKLIEEKDFQDKLNIISKFNYSHFEKWFQVELSCFFEKNNCDHFDKFEWKAEKSIIEGKIRPDFTVSFVDGKTFFTEIKQNNNFNDCLTSMINDFDKVVNVIGTQKSENVNCIGIFETDSRNESKLEACKNEFERYAFLFDKLEEIKILNTKYSLMYF
ncbi:hypothetical protein RCS94_06840 [Orbaceae bacterium ac157xtp]